MRGAMPPLAVHTYAEAAVCKHSRFRLSKWSLSEFLPFVKSLP